MFDTDTTPHMQLHLIMSFLKIIMGICVSVMFVVCVNDSYFHPASKIMYNFFFFCVCINMYKHVRYGKRHVGVYRTSWSLAMKHDLHDPSFYWAGFR